MQRREALRATLFLFAAPAVTAAAWNGREIIVSGRAVCLHHGEPGPAADCSFGEQLGIESPDGTIHRLDPTDLRGEILTDERVSRHPLEVALWQEDGLGKIIRLYTIQDGKAIEPYYFCFTCNITSHLPGPCWCCQEDFEFMERPAHPSTDLSTGGLEGVAQSVRGPDSASAIRRNERSPDRWSTALPDVQWRGPRSARRTPTPTSWSPEQLSQDIQVIRPGCQDVDLRLGEPFPAVG